MSVPLFLHSWEGQLKILEEGWNFFPSLLLTLTYRGPFAYRDEGSDLSDEESGNLTPLHSLAKKNGLQL